MANKKTNYNKMSEKSVKEEAVVETVETTEEVTIGVVVNCEKLNVRALPKKNADIICTINKGDKVEIVKGTTTVDFYGVRSKDIKADIGFCMKDFIAIK